MPVDAFAHETARKFLAAYYATENNDDNKRAALLDGLAVPDEGAGDAVTNAARDLATLWGMKLFGPNGVDLIAMALERLRLALAFADLYEAADDVLSQDWDTDTRTNKGATLGVLQHCKDEAFDFFNE